MLRSVWLGTLLVASCGHDPSFPPMPAPTTVPPPCVDFAAPPLPPMFPAGKFPRAIAVGDLNGDGLLDVVVANAPGSGPDTVSVLMRATDGSFVAPVAYVVGAQPRAIGLSDLDHDGHLDLVVANEGDSTTSVLIGRGDGTFRAQVAYSGVTYAHALAIADLDGDGHPDLALAADSGGIGVMLNNGDGTFGAPAFARADPGGNITYAVAIGDVDGDGKPDLVASTTDHVGVMHGNGDGTFAAPNDFAAVNASSFALVDFDGDGKLDLVATTTPANGFIPSFVNVFPGRGDGTFGTPMTSDIVRADSLAVGDLDGDGRLDIVVVDGVRSGVDYLFNTGAGFTSPSFYATMRPTAVAIGRTDGGVAMELLVVAAASGPDFIGDVIRLDARAGGAFGPVQDELVPAPIQAAADLDGDGHVDLVVGATVFFGHGDGTFAPAIVYGQDGNPLRIADVNGDGALDLVFVGAVYLNDLHASGTFVRIDSPTTAGPGFALADFNRDGHLDLAIATPPYYFPPGGILPGSIDIALGRGDGTFGAPTQVRAKGSFRVEVADFDRDGIADLVIDDAVMLGSGDGSFRPEVPHTPAVPYGEHLAVGDFNRDGIVDLAISDFYGSRLDVQLGLGDGTFAPAVTYATGAWSETLLLADVDGDGTLDAIVGRQAVGASTATASILLGNGDGTLAPAVELALGGEPSAAADFDEDGHLDLAIVLANTQATYLARSRCR
jgi:hypothetical protein